MLTGDALTTGGRSYGSPGAFGRALTGKLRDLATRSRWPLPHAHPAPTIAVSCSTCLSVVGVADNLTRHEASEAFRNSVQGRFVFCGKQVCFPSHDSGLL